MTTNAPTITTQPISPSVSDTKMRNMDNLYPRRPERCEVTAVRSSNHDWYNNYIDNVLSKY